MRVATYNIRNLRALDRSSLWWRRRARLARAIGELEADLVGMQEAYGAQIGWLRSNALRAPEWEVVGLGRNTGGGGEAVPLWFRSAVLREVTNRTRWFGPTPDRPGSRPTGAQFPRIATLAEFEALDTADEGRRLVVVNLHLDSSSAERRGASLAQLVEWLAEDHPGVATIVMGDFNGPMDEPGFAALAEAGLRSALPGDAGPTSNGFGRALDSQQQIDHVFVSEHFRVDDASIVTSAGHASDHYPVVVDLGWVDQMRNAARISESPPAS